MRQASRRSWRIGQRQPVEVTFMVYEGTLQAEALALVAAKMRSALMIEGELPEGGLAALEGNDQDVMVALARRLARQDTSNGRSLEALFAQRRDADAADAHYITGDEWTVTAPNLDANGSDSNVSGLLSLEQSSRLPVVAEGTADVGSPGANAPVPKFEELARLVRRSRPRSGAVPVGQLKLFSD